MRFAALHPTLQYLFKVFLMAQKPVRRKLVKKKQRQSLLQRVRYNFLTGLVVVAPIFLTIYLVWIFVGFIDDRVLPFIPAQYNPKTYLGSDIPGFGVAVFLLGTTLIGWTTKGLFGRQLVRWGEQIVDRTPIIRSIYNAVKQIVETIFSQSNTSFQNACLIQYPREGLWAVAFVSTEAKGELPNATGQNDLVSVFLPTTPNPTSGFLLFVPRSDMVVLDMSVEEAAKLVISAGLVVPPTKEEIRAGRKPVSRNAA